jgi:hypothetical protein
MNKKNILLFVGDDIVAHMFLNHFVPQMMSQDIHPILILVEGTKPKAYNYKELNRYYFYETQLLNDIVFPYLNQTDVGFNTKSLTRDQLIDKYNLQTISTDNVNNDIFVDQLKTIDFIGAISVRCFQIFKSHIIQTIQTKGFFCNSHPGILPYHKGVFCMLRGIVNDQKHLGWTMHEIDEGIDTGRIIKRIRIQNHNASNPIPLYEQSIESLSDGWIDYINEYMDHGYVDSYKQNLAGDYYTYPTEKNMNDWVDSGKLQLIDTRTMVSMYYDMFIPHTAKFQKQAMDFKILLINKISQFETMIDSDINIIEFSATAPSKIAA